MNTTFDGFLNEGHKRIDRSEHALTSNGQEHQKKFYELFVEYDELVDKLPQLVKELKKLKHIDSEWGMNRKAIVGIMNSIKELEKHINDIVKT